MPLGRTTSPVVPAGVSKLKAVMLPLPSAVMSVLKLPRNVDMPAETLARSPVLGSILHVFPAAPTIRIPATYRLRRFVGPVDQPWAKETLCSGQ